MTEILPAFQPSSLSALNSAFSAISAVSKFNRRARKERRKKNTATLNPDAASQINVFFFLFSSTSFHPNC